MSLSPKQKKFCREYLVDYNGKQAAIRAGYSPKTAKQQACDLLTRPDLKAFIKELSKPIEQDLAVTAHNVLKHMTRRAYVDPLSFFKEIEVNGVLRIVTKFPSELTKDQRMAVDDMKIGEDERPIYRLANKDVSLDKLGKHLKLFTDMDPLVQSFTVMGQVLVDGKPLVFNVGQPAPQFDIKNAPKPKEKKS